MWYLTDTKTNTSEHDEDLINLIWDTLEDIDIVNYINKTNAGTVFIPYVGDISFGEAAVAIANDKCQYSDLAYDIAQDMAYDILSKMKILKLVIRKLYTIAIILLLLIQNKGLDFSYNL